MHSRSVSPVMLRGLWSHSLLRCIGTRDFSSGTSYLSPPPNAREKKKALDKDFIVSVLETSPTRRDAKGYLKKYVPNRDSDPGRSASLDSPSTSSTSERAQDLNQSKGSGILPKQASESAIPNQFPLHVALVKFRLPQIVDDRTLRGVAKTLSQLRTLGLLSVIVVDCGYESRTVTREQSWRISYAISRQGGPGATVIEQAVEPTKSSNLVQTSYLSPFSIIACPEILEATLRRGSIPVIPATPNSNDIAAGKAADSNSILLALVNYLSGLQCLTEAGRDSATQPNLGSFGGTVSVERIIVLDPLGGIPVEGLPSSCHRFINLEQEYDDIIRHLKSLPTGKGVGDTKMLSASCSHAENLMLARKALAVLPSTSSALITSPAAAANTLPRQTASKTNGKASTEEEHITGFIGTVKTRTVQNPLIHNLLTDKPVYSSSLPLKQASPGTVGRYLTGVDDAIATLVKRGIPVTIYPDPSTTSWEPPNPGAPRLRLTDTCIDLPRLVRLIEDSFGRTLDVQHYLNRVNEKLAGVIIAGEYEGGAILTWEQPAGLDESEASASGRLVPYLDKFAVLKSRQGSGGVADIVFKAMVRDCFPTGVCWRSRADNPVNKWYFERSIGTLRLLGANWTMFWTTPNLPPETFQDYESVCRGVIPSWLSPRKP